MKVDISSSNADPGRRKPAMTPCMTWNLHFSGATTTRAVVPTCLSFPLLTQPSRALSVLCLENLVGMLHSLYRLMICLVLGALVACTCYVSVASDLSACIEAALMVATCFYPLSRWVIVVCCILKRLARTGRCVVLLLPMGRKALVLIRSAILLNLKLCVPTFLTSLGAKRSFVAGVVIDFLNPEQMARQCAQLTLLSLWPRQGGTGTCLRHLSSRLNATVVDYLKCMARLWLWPLMSYVCRRLGWFLRLKPTLIHFLPYPPRPFMTYDYLYCLMMVNVCLQLVGLRGLR